MIKETSRAILIKNASIIDGTGADPKENAAVLIRGERIEEVYHRVPRGGFGRAQVIDAKNQFLLPGLIDAHVHIGAQEVDIGMQQRAIPPSLLIIKSLRTMEETLEQGFTTVRDAGGADVGIREAQRQGLIRGPRILVSGKPLSQTGGHGDFRLWGETGPPLSNPAGLSCIVCDGVEEVRKAAREQLRMGVDQIKVMAGGGAMSPTDELEAVQFSQEELRAIVWEAKAAGKYVMAHVYSAKSIFHAVEAGVRSIEHGNFLDEASAKAIREANGFLVPTLATYEMIWRMRDKLQIPKENMRKIERARERAEEALRLAHKMGLNMGSGSDLLGPMQGVKALELELKAKVLGTMGAIVLSTRDNARLLGLDSHLGTIEPGKLADLILVNGDPLRDISVLQRYKEKITLIIQGGVIQKNIISG